MTNSLFRYNLNEEVNAIGREDTALNKPIGPTVSGIIDCRDQVNPLHGFVIEEGAVPAALAPLLRTMLEALPGSTSPKDVSLAQQLKKIVARIRSGLLGPYAAGGSIEKTQVYLVMSHDTSQAILTLEHNKPVLRWLGVGRSERVKRLNGILAKATESMGGTFVNNPFFAALGEQEVRLFFLHMMWKQLSLSSERSPYTLSEVPV